MAGLAPFGMTGRTNSGVVYLGRVVGSSVPPGTTAAPAVDARRATGSSSAAAPAAAPAPMTCRRVTMGAPFPEQGRTSPGYGAARTGNIGMLRIDLNRSKLNKPPVRAPGQYRRAVEFDKLQSRSRD